MDHIWGLLLDSRAARTLGQPCLMGRVQQDSAENVNGNQWMMGLFINLSYIDLDNIYIYILR